MQWILHFKSAHTTLIPLTKQINTFNQKENKKHSSMKMAFRHSFTKCVIISIFNHLSPSNVFLFVSIIIIHISCSLRFSFYTDSGSRHGLIMNVNSPESHNCLPIAEEKGPTFLSKTHGKILFATEFKAKKKNRLNCIVHFDVNYLITQH